MKVAGCALFPHCGRRHQRQAAGGSDFYVTSPDGRPRCLPYILPPGAISEVCLEDDCDLELPLRVSKIARFVAVVGIKHARDNLVLTRLRRTFGPDESFWQEPAVVDWLRVFAAEGVMLARAEQILEGQFPRSEA